MHKNYGSISHTNTGYNNHTNTYANSYVDHTNTYADSYSNHTNTYANSYSNHKNYNHFNGKNIEEIFQSQNLEDFVNDDDIQLFAGGSYSDYRGDHYNYSQGYSVHRNYAQSGYSVHNNYNQSGYSVHNNYNQSGANSHNNAGYTNHVNTTTNTPPTNVSNVSKGSAVYYKDSITLTWTAATDNNKCIWGAAAWWQDYASCPDRGIWENTTLVQSEGRSWSAYRWNSSGTRVSASGVFDTYGDAGRVQPFINYLNTYNIGDYFVIIGSHEPNNNAAPIHNLLKSWGFSFPHLNDIASWVGICKMGTGILAEQSARRYGKDYATVSASYTIPGVSSGQTISYYIDYCFKPIGGVYGEWTRIVNNHTSTSYAYNLSAHGNGHIKFRVLSTDGVENSASWIESSEVRVLKYTAPSSWATSEKAIGTEVENLKIEINKLATAVGTVNSSQAATSGNTITKTLITDLRDKVKLIGPQISKTNPTDSNIDKITKADIDNLKNWLKQV